MATKSVIEIEIIDEQFKAFDVQLKAIQAIVASLPNQWKAVTKEVEEEQKAEKKAADEAEKYRKKRFQDEKNYNKLLEDRKKSFMDAAYFTGNIAKNLASGALSLAKWTAFGAIGGGFGLGALASSSTSYRTSSRTIGLSSGELRAAEAVLEPYFPDAKGILNKIADIQSNQLEQYKLTGAGGSNRNSTFENFFDILDKAKSAIDSSKGKVDIAYAKQPYLKEFLSPDDLRNLYGLSKEEVSSLRPQTTEQSKRLITKESDAIAFQKFLTALKESGHLVETSFIQNLKILTPELSKLSKAVAEAMQRFLSSKQFAKWMEKLDTGIDKFANYLSSDKALKDFDKFLDNIDQLANAVGKVARFFGLIKTTPEEKRKEQGEKIADQQEKDSHLSPKQRASKAQIDAFWDKTFFGRGTSQRNNAIKGIHGLKTDVFNQLEKIEKDKGLPSGTFKGLLTAENSSDFDVNPQSGARGRFQVIKPTAEAYGITNPEDVIKSASGVGDLMKDLLKQFHGNQAEAYAAYNWGSGNLEHYLKGDKGYIGNDNKYHKTDVLPTETVKYIEHAMNVTVNVNNKAGSDITVTKQQQTGRSR